MKSIIAAGILLGALHGATAPAIAGPYLEGEVEFTGTEEDYKKNKSQARAGYEWDFNGTKPYIEVGGGAVTPDGGDADGFLAIEAGAKHNIGENLSVKASFEQLRFEDETDWKVKVGTKYSF